MQRCAGCQQPITKVDLVLRIRGQTFHVGCFRCVVCSAILQPGEEIAFRRNMPYCLRDAKLAPPDDWTCGEPQTSITPTTTMTTTTTMEAGDPEPKILTLLSPAIPPPMTAASLKPTEDVQQPKLADSGEMSYFSPQPPQRTRSACTSSSLDGPMGENGTCTTVAHTTISRFLPTDSIRSVGPFFVSFTQLNSCRR